MAKFPEMKRSPLCGAVTQPFPSLKVLILPSVQFCIIMNHVTAEVVVMLVDRPGLLVF